MGEMWKTCIENCRYKVSSYGRVKRVSGGQGAQANKILKPWKHYKGYLQIRVGSKKCYKVHRLIAAAFIGPCPKGKQVNHKDGIKKHNHAANLEYVTPSENIYHGYKIGLIDRKGSKHPQTSLTEKDVKKIIKLYNETDLFQREIGEMYGIEQSTVSQIVRGISWSHI